MRSRIEPIKKVARLLRGHRDLLLNWFRAKKEISAGVVEGLNGKARLITFLGRSEKYQTGFGTPAASRVKVSYAVRAT